MAAVQRWWVREMVGEYTHPVEAVEAEMVGEYTHPTVEAAVSAASGAPARAAAGTAANTDAGG
jgi:hypothetical protein